MHNFVDILSFGHFLDLFELVSPVTCADNSVTIMRQVQCKPFYARWHQNPWRNYTTMLDIFGIKLGQKSGLDLRTLGRIPKNEQELWSLGQMVDTCGRNWETQGEKNNKRKKKANFMLLVICGKTVYTTVAPIRGCFSLGLHTPRGPGEWPEGPDCLCPWRDRISSPSPG